jgi:threonine/homoserine/homoserine lactone efflux protein
LPKTWCSLASFRIFASGEGPAHPAAVPFDLVTVLVIMTVSLVTPGPDMLVVLKNSLGGRSRGLSTVAGITVGLALQTTALSIGFTLLTAHTSAISGGLRWGGACVLIWFGVRALFSRTVPTAMDPAASAKGMARDAFLEGLLCNLTNPKAFLFFTGLFSQLIRPDSPAWISYALPALLTVHGAVCWTVIALLLQAGGVATRLQRAQHILVRIFGALLVLFGLGLLFWRP